MSDEGKSEKAHASLAKSPTHTNPQSYFYSNYIG